MTNYRLYPQDKSGHFLGVIEFIAPDDTIAREIGERTAAGQSAEIWNGGRFVARFQSSTNGAEPEA